MVEIFRSEKGSALLVTFALLVSLFLAISLSLNTAKTDVDLSFNQLGSERAFYLAQAGAHRAEVELARDQNWQAGFTNVAFGGGIYGVTVIRDSSQPGLGDTVILRAAGSIKGASGVIEEWLYPDITHPYKYALFARDSLTMMNNANTNSFCADSGTYAATRSSSGGDIGSNGVVVINENVVVNGSASTSKAGGMTITHATVTGDTTTKAAPASIASVPQSSFDQAKANNSAPAGLSGSGYTFNTTTKILTMGNNATLQLASGTYYFTEFHADNNAVITVASGAKVTIYVQKQMTLRNNTTFNKNGGPGNVTILGADGEPAGTHEFIVENNGEFWGSYYGPDTEAWVSNNGVVYGSLVGSKVLLDNNEAFHYDRSLKNKKGPVTGNLKRIAWREL